jgi:hypothetical protein
MIRNLTLRKWTLMSLFLLSILSLGFLFFGENQFPQAGLLPPKPDPLKGGFLEKDASPPRMAVHPVQREKGSNAPSETKLKRKDFPLTLELKNLPLDEKVRVYFFKDGPLFQNKKYSVFFPGKITDLKVPDKVTPVSWIDLRGQGLGRVIEKKILLPAQGSYRVVVRGSPSLFMVSPSHEDWVGRKIKGGYALKGGYWNPCPLSSPLKWKEKQGFPKVRILFQERTVVNLWSTGDPKGTWDIRVSRVLEREEGSVIEKPGLMWQHILLRSFNGEEAFQKKIRFMAGKVALSILFASKPKRRRGALHQDFGLFFKAWDSRKLNNVDLPLSSMKNPFFFTLDEGRIPRNMLGKEEILLVSNDKDYRKPGDPFPSDPRQNPCAWVVTYKRGGVLKISIPTPQCRLTWLRSSDKGLEIDLSKKTHFFWTPKGWK